MKELTASEKKKIRRGLRTLIGWVVVGVVFAAFSGVVTGCRKEEKPTIYKVTTRGLVWETSPENPRQKVPVVKDMVYFVVGDSACDYITTETK